MKKYLLITTLLLITSSLNAQWTSNVALNTLVRDSSGIGEVTPLSATTLNGSTYISWFEPASGVNYKLKMQRLGADGVKQWQSDGITVSAYPQNTALFRYDLTTDLEGNAIVAFQDERSGQLDIAVYKVDTAGNLVWGAAGVTLTDSLSTQGLAPTIGITASNNIIIAWNPNATSKWIAFQKLTPSGSPMWSGIKRITSTTVKYSRPTMVAAGSDDFTMLYAEETGSGFPPTSKLYSQRFDQNGNAVWASPVIVSSKTIPFFYFPKAMSDENEGYYVAFNASLNSNPSVGDVYVQHVNGNGALWSTTGTPASALTNYQKFTAGIAVEPGGSHAIITMKFTDLNQSQSGVYQQRIDSAGNLLMGSNASQVIAVSAAYHDPYGSAVTPTGIITGYVTGNPPNQTISAAKTDYNGVVQWNGNSVTICSTVSAKDDGAVGLFRNNQVVFVWQDERSGGGIYAQNISDGGVAGPQTSTIKELTSGNFILSGNPSTDLNIINLSNSQNIHIRICDIEGKLIQEYEWKSGDEIRLQPKCISGIYFVTLTNISITKTLTWVKE